MSCCAKEHMRSRPDLRQWWVMPSAHSPCWRIMKKILPPNAKISKEAKETMQECVSEFISFVTSEASEKCKKGKAEDCEWR